MCIQLISYFTFSVLSRQILSQIDGPGNVQVILANGVGTFYSPSEQAIHVDDSINPLVWYPDTFDKHVIAHEYGHRLEDKFNFFDGGRGSHIGIVLFH